MLSAHHLTDLRLSSRARACMVLTLHAGIGIEDVARCLRMHYVDAADLLAGLAIDGHVSRERKGRRYRYWGTQASERLVMGEVARVEAEARVLLSSMLVHPLCKRERVKGLLG
jgi:hypothetical protein